MNVFDQHWLRNCAQSYQADPIEVQFFPEYCLLGASGMSDDQLFCSEVEKIV